MMIAEELALSFYDALYIAVAERWDCHVVTADERILVAASNTRFRERVAPLRAYRAVDAE